MFRSLSQYRQLFESNPNAIIGTELLAWALVARDHRFCNTDNPEHEKLFRRYFGQYRERVMCGIEALRLLRVPKAARR